MPADSRDPARARVAVDTKLEDCAYGFAESERASMKVTDFSRTQPPNDSWLRTAFHEQVVDPDIPIVDAHLHLWHHSSGYRYFVPDYAEDALSSGHNIEAAIYVECNSMYRAFGPLSLRSVGETEFAVGQAAVAASHRYTSVRVAAGIVAFVDLRDPAVEHVLDTHVAAANGRLRGIRQRAKWDPDPAVRGPVSADSPGLYLDRDFQANVAQLAKYNLSFEASIFHPQMPDVCALAQAAPDVTIVLGHTGSPVGHSSYAGRRDAELARWTSDMKQLARFPNVIVKIGGLLMPQGTYDFRLAPRPPTSDVLADLWRPYIERSVEIFGAARCMIGSNFPVDKVGLTYGAFWNSLQLVLAGLSTTERREAFAGTARRVYSL